MGERKPQLSATGLKSRLPSFSLEALEQRVLLSADPVAAAPGAATGEIPSVVITEFDPGDKSDLGAGADAFAGVEVEPIPLAPEEQDVLNSGAPLEGSLVLSASALELEDTDSELIAPANLDDSSRLSAFSTNVTIQGLDSAEEIYLRASAGMVQRSSSGAAGTFSDDLDPNVAGVQSFTIENGSVLQFNLKKGNDSLHLEAVLMTELVSIGASIVVDGGEGSDKLVGAEAETTWEVDGPNAGNVDSVVTFSNVENLTGAPNVSDLFNIFSSGSLSGEIDAGLEGVDWLTLTDTTGSTRLTITAADVPFPGQKGATTIAGELFVSSLVFKEGEKITLNAGNNDNLITLAGAAFDLPSTAINANGGNDVITFLRNAPVAGFSFDGGAGSDTIVYSSTAALTITDSRLLQNSIDGAGGGGSPLTSIERAVIEAPTLSTHSDFSGLDWTGQLVQ
jgi:hypothetical protein